MVKARVSNQVTRVTAGSYNKETTVSTTNNPSQYWAQVAEAYATKMDGMVANEDYSAKYYATKAKEGQDSVLQNVAIVENVANTSIENINTIRTEAIRDIESAISSIDTQISAGVEELSHTVTDGVEEVETTIATGLASIGATEITAIANIQAVENTGVQNLTNTKDEVLSATANSKSEIVAEKNNALSEVATSRQNALSDINGTKTTVITEINATAQPILSELDTVEVVVDNIDTVVEIGENIDNILNKTVTVGKTITGETGTPAKVVNSGTKYNPILDFTLPRGETGRDGGLNATYDEAAETLSFFNESGTVLTPKWGTITGDIASQEDLKTALDSKLSRNEVPDIPDMSVYVKNTDYANNNSSGQAGIVKCSSTFACTCVNGYIQASNIPTIERYNNLGQYAFIGKGTLETALTQYSKTVLTTEADYNALETKDANTLYLIEEE